MDLKKNQLLSGTVSGYTSEGAGVCHTDGKTVFIPGTLVGEEWEFRVVKVTSSLVWGKAETCRLASPERRSPDCGVYPLCGGCSLRHMSYPEELTMKLDRVNDAFRRIGKLSLNAAEILPAEGEGFRRRKVIFNVGEKNGKPVLGFYRSRSHDIVPLACCPAVFKGAEEIGHGVLEWMEDEKIPVYKEDPPKDGIRHIFLRSSHINGDTVLTLISSIDPGPEKMSDLYDSLRQRFPTLTGLVLNLNRSRGNTILAGEFRTVCGRPSLSEQLCGLTFSLSPRAFFQVNPPQAEKLYLRALEYADIREGTSALDLYCGTGTFGLCMAGKGASVIGAEIIPAAVENARENARRNGLSDQCEFFCADAGEIAAQLAAKGSRPEVILVDPPRKGLAPDVIESVVKMGPERIVYVSCDPGTLARDLSLFDEKGYSSLKATAVDMFPRTSHVETVCLLVLRNPVTHINIDVDVEDLVQDKRGQATYEQIRNYVKEQTGLHVTNLNIAQIKRKCGIIERENYNLPKTEDSKQPNCTKEKEDAILDAFRHFGMI